MSDQEKIAVVYGGLSNEREISLKSGKAVSLALVKKGYQVLEIDAENIRDLIDQLIKEKPAKVFIALHGKLGEDGAIQGLLEWLQIPYTGCSLTASAICADKIITKRLVKSIKIPTPNFWVYHQEDNFENWMKENKMTYPVILKPASEGSTIGIYRVFTAQEFKENLTKALHYGTAILIEELIIGREITISLSEEEVYPIVEIKPEGDFYDFKAKYQSTKTAYLIPAELDEQLVLDLQKQVRSIYQSLKLAGMVRMDYMIDQNNQPYFLEVNTIPGMTSSSLLPKSVHQVGISFEELCEQIIKKAKLHLVS